MTDVQTLDLIESPFTKVNKGLEVVGNWPKYLRDLKDGTMEEELRCSCFYYIHKRTPKLRSEIMTDDITAGVVAVLNIIQRMISEITGVNYPSVVVE